MNRVVPGLVIVLQLVAAGAASEAQPQKTIRAELVEAGFAAAAAAAAAPALDEPVTSSEFAANNRMFVAAYYLQKELDGHALGPLRVSAFDKSSGRWSHASSLDASGSVLRVDVTGPYVLVTLHTTPSAGTGLVFDATTLSLVGSLNAFALQGLASGEILFWANMLHFAPTHQQRLMLYTPHDRLESQIFPGRTPTPIASAYHKLIQSTYASLPSSTRQDIETSGYGPVDDFDRSISHVVESADQRRLVFFIEYSSGRLSGRVQPIASIGHCRRQESHTWTCDEMEFDAAATSAGTAVSRRRVTRPDSAQIDRVVRRIAGLR